MTDVRKNRISDVWPDSKTRVKIAKSEVGSWIRCAPKHSHRVQLISTRHTEPLKTVRSQEVARFSRIEELGPAWKT